MACAVPQQCAPRFKTLLRLYFLFPLLLCVGWLVLALAYLPPVWALAAGICTGLLTVAAVYLPGMYYDRMYYTRHAQWLKLERGLFLRSIILIPRGQIISTRLRRGPLERLLGVSTVILITTAGRVSLPGLTTDDSARLRELVDREPER